MHEVIEILGEIIPYCVEILKEVAAEDPVIFKRYGELLAKSWPD